jgi:hypothetical protein
VKTMICPEKGSETDKERKRKPGLTIRLISIIFQEKKKAIITWHRLLRKTGRKKQKERKNTGLEWKYGKPTLMEVNGCSYALRGEREGGRIVKNIFFCFTFVFYK